jgi:hypothetical protein
LWEVTHFWNRVDLIQTAQVESVDPRDPPSERKRKLEAEGLYPPHEIDSNLLRKLHQLSRSSIDGIPGAAILKNGKPLHRVLFIGDNVGLYYRAPFWQRFVYPDFVVQIVESPYLLPEHARKLLASVPQNKSGSLEFEVILDDGKRFNCCYSGYSNFIELPSPYSASMVVDIKPKAEAGSVHDSVLVDPDHVWCVFKDDSMIGERD